jgi:mitochondrial intermembrane space import and assembly protein 40
MGKDTIYFIDKDNNMELKKESVDGEQNVQPQSAINEETGEINWDCPCLKSALAPPCGELFKEAFSCFVASKAEPKGSDCLEQFSKMQECFRAHPEIYMGDDEEDADDDAADSRQTVSMNEDAKL